MSLLDMYTTKIKSGGSTTISALALGEINKAPGKGVNFMDGQARGPWNYDSSEVDDVWQKGFVPNSGPIDPATTNTKAYPLSRWVKGKEELAFSGKGPPGLTGGYHRNTRYTTLNDIKNKDILLHNYTPRDKEGFADVDTWGKTRVTAGPTSTSVRGLQG